MTYDSETVKRIRDAEMELGDIAMDIEFSRSLSALLEHPGWKVLTQKLTGIMDGETKKLRTERMDEYELGRRQGRLAMLQYMMRQEPMTEEEVAACQERVTLLREQIDADRLDLR